MSIVLSSRLLYPLHHDVKNTHLSEPLSLSLLSSPSIPLFLSLSLPPTHSFFFFLTLSPGVFLVEIQYHHCSDSLLTPTHRHCSRGPSSSLPLISPRSLFLPFSVPSASPTPLSLFFFSTLSYLSSPSLCSSFRDGERCWPASSFLFPFSAAVLLAGRGGAAKAPPSASLRTQDSPGCSRTRRHLARR